MLGDIMWIKNWMKKSWILVLVQIIIIIGTLFLINKVYPSYEYNLKESKFAIEDLQRIQNRITTGEVDEKLEDEYNEILDNRLKSGKDSFVNWIFLMSILIFGILIFLIVNVIVFKKVNNESFNWKSIFKVFLLYFALFVLIGSTIMIESVLFIISFLFIGLFIFYFNFLLIRNKSFSFKDIGRDLFQLFSFSTKKQFLFWMCYIFILFVLMIIFGLLLRLGDWSFYLVQVLFLFYLNIPFFYYYHLRG
jgi:hypothetical protein